MGGIVGVVLAAGEGTRFGGPKALARTASGEPWVVRAIAALRGGGCDEVVVVLGAAADDARALIPREAQVVTAGRWRIGVAASLAAGLDVDAVCTADVIAVTLVDLPDLPEAVVRRVLEVASGRADLARATYAGLPGHPVVLGQDHRAGLRDSLHGDEGGRAYLALHGATEVECGDLFHGRDVDRPRSSFGRSGRLPLRSPER